MNGSGEQGILFVISAPSGAGKSTLVDRLLENLPGVRFSVSFTTRPRREGEEDGVQYHFVDEDRFEAMVRDCEFLEWAEVHDHRYGTGRAVTEAALAEGTDLVLDVDVQGARQVRDSGVEAVYVFVLPPDFSTLEGRLRSRASETDGQVMRRLAVAREEVEEARHYDYLLVNDDLDGAADALRSIVVAERRRVRRCLLEAERIQSTFPIPNVPE